MGSIQTKRQSKYCDALLLPNERKKVPIILLLGIGLSGKSTLFKHISFLYDNTFVRNFKEYSSQATYLWDNMIKNLITMYNEIINNKNLNNDIEILKLKDEVINNINTKNALQCLINNQTITDNITDKNPFILKELIESMLILWNFKPFKKWYNKNKFNLLRSLIISPNIQYYLNNIDRICDVKCKLSNTDVLLNRVRTTGIATMEFKYNDYYKFELILTGGQRNERRKWIQQFNISNIIIYMYNLNNLDYNIYECLTKNDFDESLETFQQLINYKLFRNKTFILWLNCYNLFKYKMLNNLYNFCNNNDKNSIWYINKIKCDKYVENKDVHSMFKFIKHSFKSQIRHNKKVYLIVTDVINSNQVSNSIQKIVKIHNGNIIKYYTKIVYIFCRKYSIPVELLHLVLTFTFDLYL